MTAEWGSRGGTLINAPHYWPMYFPSTEFDPAHPRMALANDMAGYFRTVSRAIQEKVAEVAQSETASSTRAVPIPVDWEALCAYCETQDLYAMMRDSPASTLSVMGFSLHKIAYDRPGMERKILPRPYNFGSITSLRLIRSHLIGRLITIRGTVIRVSIIKPLVQTLSFTCTKCGEATSMPFVDGRYAPPSKCENEGCRGKTFNPDRRDAVTVDWQKIRVQEALSDDQQDEGRIPRTIEVELTEDLVDSVVPGDSATITGIVKVMSASGGDRGRGAPPSSGGGGRGGRGGRGGGARAPKRSAMYILYLDAVGMQTHSKATVDEGHEFDLNEMYGIRKIAQSEDPFHLIVNSLCPGIYGNEFVKAGLMLALFGGTAKPVIRSDPHCLVVGDPGLGKSQMLQAASRVAPRGVYVCGNTTTSSGLTVTVLKDAITGDYTLEAGALVLGDQGVCCIDEFDKMTAEHAALLEAMEQQSISVAKAGIVCSLPARTCVLAAANPKKGHYDPSASVNENIQLGAALLSRFDLLYILKDTPDAARDQLLSAHVMSIHSGGRDMIVGAAPQRPVVIGDARTRSQMTLSAMTLSSGVTGKDHVDVLRERLRALCPEPIPTELLRKYVRYARKYVHPVLSGSAKKVLQRFYVDLRARHHSQDSTPITTRQLESLIRLAEARAKLELSETVTKEHAQEVVTMMTASMYDVLLDENGNLDATRTSGMSNKKMADKLLAAIQAQDRLWSFNEIADVAGKLGIKRGKVWNMVSALSEAGVILKKPGGWRPHNI